MADAGIGETALASAALGDAGATTAALGAGEGLGGFGALNLGGGAAANLVAPEVAAMASGAGASGMGGLGINAAAGMGSMANVFNPMGNAMMGNAPVASTLIPSVSPTDFATGTTFNNPSFSPDQVGNLLTNPAPPDVPLNPLDKLSNWYDRQSNMDLLKYGGAGLGAYTLYNILTGRGNHYLPGYTPPSAASYGLGRTLSSNYMPTRPYAEGGIASLNPNPSMMSSGPAHVDFMGGDMYPMSQNVRSYYATPTQAPLSAQQAMAGYEPATNPLTGEPTANMAEGGDVGTYVPGQPARQPEGIPESMAMGIQQLGRYLGLNRTVDPTKGMYLPPDIARGEDYYVDASGHTHPGSPPVSKAAGGALGSYSDGGQMLKGPGDGMSDNIPASIGDKQPARLADGEFVVPADVVSHLGNGSTDAGAKQLYAMLDKVRKARTGNPKQGKQINPSKFMPA